MESLEVMYEFKVVVIDVFWRLVVGYVGNCKFIIDICVFFCFVKIIKYSKGFLKCNVVLVVKEIVVFVGNDFEFC